MLHMLSRVALVLVGSFVSVAAFAEEGAAAGSGNGLAAAIAISVAAFGGALGQAWAASSALSGMARNPQSKLLAPMIVALALIESLVIYALLVAFRLV